MNEKELRQQIRIMIASVNDKYPKMPLLKWMDFEDAIVHLVKTSGESEIRTHETFTSASLAKKLG